MMYVTTSDIQGSPIKKVFGTVRGSTVRAKWFGADLIAGIRNIFGGEIVEYSKLLEEAREQSIGRMLENAEEVGANAVVNVRFMTAQIGRQAAEIMVYGTAVQI